MMDIDTETALDLVIFFPLFNPCPLIPNYPIVH